MTHYVPNVVAMWTMVDQG